MKCVECNKEMVCIDKIITRKRCIGNISFSFEIIVSSCSVCGAAYFDYDTLRAMSIYTAKFFVLAEEKDGIYLKHIRKACRLSREKLAKEFNVSDDIIKDWEDNSSMPDVCREELYSIFLDKCSDIDFDRYFLSNPVIGEC